MTSTLTAQQFTWVSDVVRRESAIVLAPGKEYLVEARLLPVARLVGASSVAELVERLRARPDAATVRRVVEALTTNETSWFRDGDPFTAVATTVVPSLLAARGAAEPLRLWSAACSSGQEPYTLGMILLDALSGSGRRAQITATDLSTEMVERTRAGRFSQLEVNRGLPAPMLVRHFTRAGNEWQVSAELRSMVAASTCNLAAPLPRSGPYDVVFLRNVLIYFDLATKQDILRRVRALMRPDGWLFLGAAETTLGVDDSWERVVLGRTSAYRPAGAGSASPPPAVPATASLRSPLAAPAAGAPWASPLRPAARVAASVPAGSLRSTAPPAPPAPSPFRTTLTSSRKA